MKTIRESRRACARVTGYSGADPGLVLVRLASRGLRALGKGGLRACHPRKILDFRISEIVHSSELATYCAGGEWRSGLYIAVCGV